MAFAAQIIADSVSPEGVRLTTFEVEYPHAIHKDIMTHRMFDRNFKSFRAFPPDDRVNPDGSVTKGVISNIVEDPFIPESFDSRVNGMGQGAALEDQEWARDLWGQHIDHSLNVARIMCSKGLAKAQVNFVLQDLTWIRGIITATDWENFWALRSWPDNVRPEVKKIATMMEQAYLASEPNKLGHDEWALPYVFPEERDVLADTENAKLVSAGRCARISYLTHDGKRHPDADLGLAANLRSDGHMSPYGHQARPFSLDEWDAIRDCQATISKHLAIPKHVRDLMCRELEYRGNLRGWHQQRKDFPNEHNYAEYHAEPE